MRTLYEFWAARFCAWAERQGMEPSDTALSQWLSMLSQGGYSELSVVQAGDAVHSFFKYKECAKGENCG